MHSERLSGFHLLLLPTSTHFLYSLSLLAASAQFNFVDGFLAPPHPAKCPLLSIFPNHRERKWGIGMGLKHPLECPWQHLLQGPQKKKRESACVFIYNRDELIFPIPFPVIFLFCQRFPFLAFDLVFVNSFPCMLSDFLLMRNSSNVIYTFSLYCIT